MHREVVFPDLIERLTPRHDRLSCDDNNPVNGYGGWTGKYDRNTGQKEIRFPRCTRCYLIQHEGEYLDDLEFAIRGTTLLVHKSDFS